MCGSVCMYVYMRAYVRACVFCERQRVHDKREPRRVFISNGDEKTVYYRKLVRLNSLSKYVVSI